MAGRGNLARACFGPFRRDAHGARHTPRASRLGEGRHVGMGVVGLAPTAPRGPPREFARETARLEWAFVGRPDRSVRSDPGPPPARPRSACIAGAAVGTIEDLCQGQPGRPRHAALAPGRRPNPLERNQRGRPRPLSRGRRPGDARDVDPLGRPPRFDGRRTRRPGRTRAAARRLSGGRPVQRRTVRHLRRVLLSIQPDVATRLACHKRDGWAFFPSEWPSWSDEDRRWLRDDFASEDLIDVDASMRNFDEIVARIRAHTAAPILVCNMSAVVPGDTVHCHQGLSLIHI